MDLRLWLFREGGGVPLVNQQHEIEYQKLSIERSWTQELTPPHLRKAPLPTRKLDGASRTSDFDKLWKRPPNRDYVHCVEPSPSYTGEEH
ncbi:hypothetical protein RJ640_023556, partial [Escallonia rubra]